ncbi:Lin1244/Lin1753 domain-containing protein [Halobacillus sp. HZG1]|uniref:Lin1244/Lin1753 domain-containing protein n=1 Tax=Halobacillus sp. HZG1 TaxID=3111769 RepID=UPI002DB73D41|nr:Lin1244/Lin1753 domain-containing protein [Halobacillus sp. HZG1]MEC3884603.1 Lin1244/Lin1753 domain-containing protein [Halobacillus sp. HZG1]
MVRPYKEGIDYFPLDIDMDQDDKVAIIEAKHGIEGFGVLVKLLMKIYKEGYYYEWNDREQLLFSKRVNVNINLVQEIVNDCIEEGLFDKNLFNEYRVLTSKGIQRRYLEAVKRRKEVRFIADFFLIQDVKSVLGNSKTAVLLVHDDGNEVNVNNNSNNVSNSTQRKVKKRESKEKDSKEYQSKELGPEKSSDADNDALVFYQQNFGLLRPNMSEKILAWIEDLGDAMVIKAMEKTLEQNKSNWAYTESILKNWSSKGITTLEQVEAEGVQFQNQNKSNGNKNHEVIPTWFNQQQSESQPKPSIDSDAQALDLGIRLNRSLDDLLTGSMERYGLTGEEVETVKNGDMTALELLQSKSKLRAVGN